MQFLIDSDNEHGHSKTSKIFKFHLFYNIRELFTVLKLRPILDAILVPTCHHFGRILDALGMSGRLLGPLGNLLGPSWGVLAASWRVLDHTSRLGGFLEESWPPNKSAGAPPGPPRSPLPNPPLLFFEKKGSGVLRSA